MTTPLTKKDKQDAATQQIADEAVEKFTYRYALSKAGSEMLKGFILSAIERATEQGALALLLEYEDGDCSSEVVCEKLDRMLRGYSKTLREIKENEDAAQPQPSKARKEQAPQVQEIRSSSESCRVLSDRFGVGKSQIANIKKGTKWINP